MQTPFDPPLLPYCKLHDQAQLDGEGIKPEEADSNQLRVPKADCSRQLVAAMTGSPVELDSVYIREDCVLLTHKLRICSNIA
jgi:hypothetical protein